MKKQFTKAFFIIFFSSLLFACAENAIKPENRSPDQNEIVAYLDELQQKWNSKDQTGFLALWHEKSRIMYSKERIVVSKEEFADILPERMKISPVMKLKIIDIQVNGNSATVKTSGSPNQRDTIKMNMKLVRENDEWYFMSWDY